MNEGRKDLTSNSDGDLDKHSIYVNHSRIVVSPDEFLLIFGQRNLEKPDEGTGLITMVTNPSFVKRFLKMLTESVEGYEQNFGEIETDYKKRLKSDAPKLTEIEENKNASE